jgi:dihydropteroate synthase
MDWPSLLANRDLPVVMGIVNVTPDSFSDCGKFFAPEAAIEHGLRLSGEGAAILDVGGESTRPPIYGGSEEVPAAEELRRVLPVVEELARRSGVPVSIDTRKAEVARRALKAGASIVNDVTALRHDPEMRGLLAKTGATVVLMHMRGSDPRTMQNDLSYDDLLGEVRGFLAAAARGAVEAGIRADRIALDPGLGFSKSPSQNLRLLREAASFASIGFPIVVGASRKNFVRVFSGADDDRASLSGSLACAAIAAERGASVVRAHDAAETVAFLRMYRAIRDARMTE